MTFRIDTIREPRETKLRFQGCLDEAALATLRDRIGQTAGPWHLVLLDGTDADPACLGALLTLRGLRVSAKSPFLARLISEDQP